MSIIRWAGCDFEAGGCRWGKIWIPSKVGVHQIQSDGDDRRIFLVGKFGRYFLAIYVGIFSVKIHIVPRARTAAASNTGEDTLNNGLYS